MKTLRTCGWAVVFTVTLLLTACASHEARVTNATSMSGPDTAITQPEQQQQTFERQGNALLIRQAWLDERESKLSMKDSELELRENAAIISRGWLNERDNRLDEKELDLERRENAVAVSQGWLDEREKVLAQKELDVDRHVNALAIQQAWLNEREMRLDKRVPDLTRQEDMLTFRQVFGDEGGQFVGRMEHRVGNYVKLAGADKSLNVADTSRTRIEGGRCYATVVFPAEYKTVAVTKPIEVPKGENLPVLYQTVTEKVKVTDEQMRWEEVLCENKLTPCRVTEVQRALYRGGYDPGPIDGIIGQQTLRAVNEFQEDYNLTVANQLTIETVRTLDANF